MHYCLSALSPQRLQTLTSVEDMALPHPSFPHTSAAKGRSSASLARQARWAQPGLHTKQSLQTQQGPWTRQARWAMLALLTALCLLTTSACTREVRLDTSRPSILSPTFAPSTANKRKQRVISLAPSLTETVYDLGAGDQLIGVTDNDDYPQAALSLPSVGDIHANLELLVAAEPDLVLVDINFSPPEQVSRLRALGLNVNALSIVTLHDLRRAIPQLGLALREPENASALAQRLDRELGTISARAHTLARRPSVFAEIWSSPMITAGQGSLLNEIISTAGGENAYADSPLPYPQVSLESLIAKNPDLIITTSGEPEQLLSIPGLHALAALHNGRAHYIAPGLLHRPTMHALEGTRILQQHLFDCEAPI